MTDALMDRIKAHRSAPDVYDPPTFDQMADYIQELTLQLLATSGQAADALDKLAEAVDALRVISQFGVVRNSALNVHAIFKMADRARKTLAKLEGGK